MIIKMENKIWKPVKGFEEYYEVSEDGEIRTIERYITLPTHKYLKKQKILTQFVDGRGYMHVKLYDGKGKPKSTTTHRVVAMTFLENPENLPEINHKDANKLNNCLSNLEWISRGDNIKHAYKYRDPKTYKGSGNKNSKLIEEQVISIRKEHEVNKTSYKQLAEKYNVGITLIGYIIRRKVWKHV
jgi:hypothetical protein